MTRHDTSSNGNGKASREPFAIVPLWIVRLRLTSLELRVLVLMCHFERLGDERLAFPGHALLSRLLSLKGTRDVQRAISSLAKRGILAKREDGGGRGNPAKWQVVRPPETSGDSPVVSHQQTPGEKPTVFSAQTSGDPLAKHRVTHPGDKEKSSKNTITTTAAAAPRVAAVETLSLSVQNLRITLAGLGVEEPTLTRAAHKAAADGLSVNDIEAMLDDAENTNVENPLGLMLSQLLGTTDQPRQPRRRRTARDEFGADTPSRNATKEELADLMRERRQSITKTIINGKI